jgi:hypothetical protein
MKPSFSSLAVDIKADALLARLAGGRLLILGGERPSSANVPRWGCPVLADVKLNDPAFGPARGGEASLIPPRPAPGLQDGSPTWFRFETALGQALFDGSCGAGKKNDLIMNPVQQDGEVWVEEFTYAESRE